MHINFFHTVYQSLLNNKEKVLIRWPSESSESKRFTGNDLLQKIGSIRMALANYPVGPGQPVLLALPVSAELVCAVLAVQAAGAVPVLPPAKVSAGSLLKLIKQQRIPFVFIAHAPSLLMKAVAFVKKFHYIPLGDDLPGTPQAISIMNVPPQQPALVSHSSGSTGQAKAIYRSHRVLGAQHQILKEAFPPWPDQTDFPLFPNILLHNLASGVTSVLPAIPRFALNEMDPATIARQLMSENVQTLTGNVFYFRRLADYLHENPSFPQVRALGIGGSPVPEALAHRLQKLFPCAAVYIIYGSSEAEPIAIRKVQHNEKIDPLAGYKVGKVNEHVQLSLSYIGEVAVAGERHPVGEIKIKGPHVAIREGEEALQTGDFGYVDAATNELYLTARKGNETICNGLQHYQLEHLLANDERVEKVAAIATDYGFDLYVQGSIPEQDVPSLLKKHTDMKTIKSIHKRNPIPVDARHLSKIIYSKLG